MPDPNPTTLGRTHARDRLHEEAMRCAAAARDGATRCTGDDRDYQKAKAAEFEMLADRLRQRGERG